MSRLAVITSLACAIGIGGIAGWGLREWQYRQEPLVLLDFPEPSPAVSIVGLTVPLPLPLPPVDPSAPAPIEPPGGGGATAAPVERITADLLLALKDGTMTGEFRGNGRDRMRLMMVNRAQQPVRLSIPAGQMFKGVHGSVIAARPAVFDFMPGESRLEDMPTLALSSMNRVEESSYMPTDDKPGQLENLLRLVAEHPEVPIPTIQTAALAILENLPATSVARFAAAESAPSQPWDTTAFRVETADLIGALALLRKMGMPDQQVVMSIDPQTRIEAMLDPLARAQAMHYYGITPDREWAYWKSELLEGNPRTRHYALHGIGRYFPEVGLKMLPTWVREKRTSPVFRNTAVIALTETRRPEALDILKGLQIELADQTELSMAIAEATTYLETSLARANRSGGRRVGFRVEYDEVPPAPVPIALPGDAPNPDLSASLAVVDEVLAELADDEGATEEWDLEEDAGEGTAVVSVALEVATPEEKPKSIAEEEAALVRSLAGED